MEKSLDLCSRSRSRFQLKKCARRHLPKDRISSLPDDILMIILSFLTFEEVMKTSLLSRRWLNVWVRTPVLHFHEPLPKALIINHRARQEFVKWVNGVLQRHKGEYIKEFKIVCDLDKCNRKDINMWLKFALARKVEHLEFNLLLARRVPNKLSDNYVFPDRFLNSSSGKVDSDVSMSQLLQFDLKCLRTLSLKSIGVSDKDVNFFLLNCPFLERLEVVGSMKLVNLVISDPTLVLKYLCIKSCLKLEVISFSNFNLVSLDIQSVGDLTLRDLPMLVVMSISGTSPSLTHSFPQVSCYSQLESLTLKAGYELKKLAQISNFYRLTKLKRLVIGGQAYGEESLTFLISIITALPQLEEFVLMLYRGEAKWFSKWYSTTMCDGGRGNSSLKSKSLKFFEFVGYSGHVSDVELIMHVAENAVGLEKIIIDPRDIHVTLPHPLKAKREQEVRNIALQQYDSLRESIPPHVHLLIR